MIATTYSNARANLKHYMDEARITGETICITAKGGNVILMSEDDYNNLMENYYLLSNPVMVRRFHEGLAAIAEGKGILLSLEDLKKMEEESK